MLNIGGLNQGVVIDHIKAGHAMQIYHYLNLEKLDCSVAIIKNAKSNKMGKKDIIKIEGPLCVDLDILGVLDDNITINMIENDKIVQKRTLTLPEDVYKRQAIHSIVVIMLLLINIDRVYGI